MYYLHCQSEQRVLSKIFGGTPSAIFVYLNFGLGLLHTKVLPKIKDCKIKWPERNEIQKYADAVHKYKPRLSYGGYAFIDGLNLRCGTNESRIGSSDASIDGRSECSRRGMDTVYLLGPSSVQQYALSLKSQRAYAT